MKGRDLMKVVMSKKDAKYIKEVLKIFMNNDPATDRVLKKIDGALEKQNEKKKMNQLEKLILEM